MKLLWVTPGNLCGLYTRCHDGAFSLLEVVISLVLSSLLLSAALGLFHHLEQGTAKLVLSADDTYQAAVMERMLASDIHTAVQCTDAANRLVVTTYNGSSFQYWLNASGQLVRVGQTGGTAVLSANIQSWHVTVDRGMISVTVAWQDGVSRTFVWISPQAVSP